MQLSNQAGITNGVDPEIGMFDNIFENNEVSFHNLIHNDGGGFYTLSRSPLNQIRNNYFHDVMTAPTNPDKKGSVNLVYLDNWSRYNIVDHNTYANIDPAYVPNERYAVKKVAGYGISHDEYFKINNDTSDPCVIAGAGPYNESQGCLATCNPPGIPENLSYASGVLSWEEVPGATGYLVWPSKDGTSRYTEYYDAKNKTQYTLDVVSNEMYYAVQAYNGSTSCRLSEYSIEVTNENKLFPIEDSHVQGGNASGQNFGDDERLAAKEASGSNSDRKSYLKFDMNSLKSEVLSAKVHLKVRNAQSGHTNGIYGVTDDTWTEDSITWNNSPTQGNQITTVDMSVGNSWIEVDVTDEVNSTLGDDGFLSVGMTSVSGAGFTSFFSKEAAIDNRPYLTYEVESFEVAPVQDANTQGGSSANNNFGTDTEVKVKTNSSASLTREGYFKFSVSAIDENVAKVELALNVQTYQSGHALSVFKVADDNWSQSTLTWNNAPATGDKISTVDVPASGEWIYLDVTDAAKNESDGTLSLVIKTTSGSEAVTFKSLEWSDASLRPKLVYSYGFEGITSSEDAYVNGGSAANTNYGTDTRLVVKNVSSSNQKRETYLKFDLCDVNQAFTSAQLRLKVFAGTPEAGEEHSVYLVSNDTWSENNITWNNKPSTTTLIETINVPDKGKWIEFDITDEVITELLDDEVISLKIVSASGDNYVGFHSSEATDFLSRPQLVFKSAVTENLALNKPAYQSSTGSGGTADRAVDGNTNGTFANGSVTLSDHTATSYEDYWEVDLGGVALIDAINLYGRGDDCCEHDTKDVYVIMSETPFTTVSFQATLAHPGIVVIHNEGTVRRPSLINIANSQGGAVAARYIRVQSSYDVPVSLAEVQVYGSFLGNVNAVVDELVASNLVIKQVPFDSGINVYPNPAINNEVNFEFTLQNPSEVIVYIYNLEGRLIQINKGDYNSGNQNMKLTEEHIGNMTEGLYLYKVKSNEFSTSGKLLI